MNAPPLRHDDDELRRLAEASAWRVKLSAARHDTAPEFEAWLSSEPGNEAAWDKIQAGWTLFGDHASAPSVLTLRRGALKRAERAGRGQWRQGWLTRVAACLMLIACAGAFALTLWPSDRAIAYATAAGERRVIMLEDGSRVSLDAASEVRVRFTDEARQLELVSGQARFDVAHNAARPFTVQARDKLVVATGTAFNVDLLSAKVQVTLIEGHVLVLDQGKGLDARIGTRLSPRKGVELHAGQQLTARDSAPESIATVSIERTTAWENGELIFENEPLAAIVERISRYAQAPVRVHPSVADRRLSGMFKAGDVPTFVATVSEYLHVKAEMQADGSIVLAPAA